jgi:hypothetical protein
LNCCGVVSNLVALSKASSPNHALARWLAVSFGVVASCTSGAFWGKAGRSTTSAMWRGSSARA